MLFDRKILANGILIDGFTLEGSEELRLNAIEWVKARISEGPPKPNLKWEEVPNMIMDNDTVLFVATVPFFPEKKIDLWIKAYHRPFCASTRLQRLVWFEVHTREANIDYTHLFRVTLDLAPDGGYPAPFLEAEEALHNLLSAALGALNNPKP